MGGATGFRSGRTEPIAQFYSSPRFCDALIHVFVAQALSFVGQRLEPHEQIEAHDFGWSEALAMIDNGEIRDGNTIAGLLMFDRRGHEATA